MIRRLTLVLALMAIGAGANLSGARADIQDFAVVNQGDKAVWYIQVRANYEQDWPKDVLGDQVLMPGEQVEILMSGYKNHCFFDVRIEDNSGHAETVTDVNLCEVAYVYFPASAKPKVDGGKQITVVNNGATAVWYIHVSPNYAQEWEDDVLGSDVLMPGMQIPVRLNGYGDHCFFDLKVQDSNGHAREYYDVNVCTTSYVNFP